MKELINFFRFSFFLLITKNWILQSQDHKVLSYVGVESTVLYLRLNCTIRALKTSTRNMYVCVCECV